MDGCRFHILHHHDDDHPPTSRLFDESTRQRGLSREREAFFVRAQEYGESWFQIWKIPERLLLFRRLVSCGRKFAFHRSPLRDWPLTAHRIVLLYPLCPFFTLFCHVVETRDESDFRLLKEVTDGLSMFAEYIASVGNLQKLCNTLISLCIAHLDVFTDVPSSC